MSKAAIVVALVILVCAVFGPTAGHAFVAYDDPSYVTDNAIVQRGLTRDGVEWALRSTDRFYWHPLTWVSHMAGVEAFGLDPAGHHLTNVTIHLATTLLVFAAFLMMTGAPGRSGVVAALFAVHPLHVEPVAWIAERKELLAGFFWFAAIVAYVRYVKRPRVVRYAVVAACVVLGLMSKPVVVTLPFALLLLDVWPLRRVGTTPPSRLLLEKAPLVACSVLSSAITYAGQQRAGAMTMLAHTGPAERAQNAVVSYATYVVQTVWPHPLAVFYPYPASIAAATFWSSAALLVLITVVAIGSRTRAPFLLTGWCWFLGVLVPMIGVVQVGGQSHADRFTYIAGVGLFVMAVWGAAHLLEPRAHGARTGMVLAVVAVCALATAASAQVRYWKDSVTLMRHAVAVTRDNAVALDLLGYSLATEGRLAEAVPYYRESLRLKPHNPLGLYNLGLALAALKKPAEAAAAFAQAARLHPAYAEAHFSLGEILMDQNRLPDAREELETALRYPMTAEYASHAHFRLGLISAYQGDVPRAKQEFTEALRFQPEFPEARANLARANSLLKQE